MAKNAKNFTDTKNGLKWKIINSLDKDAPNNKAIVEKVEDYTSNFEELEFNIEEIKKVDILRAVNMAGEDDKGGE